MAMRYVLAVMLASLGASLITVGALSVALTVHSYSLPLSFAALVITQMLPVGVLCGLGILLVYGAAILAKWSPKSRVFGIVAVAGGVPLLLGGVVFLSAPILHEGAEKLAEQAHPYLASGTVLLVIGYALIMYSAAVGRGRESR